MDRNQTPQNVRRHSQVKADLDREKQEQIKSSWKTKTASLNMKRDNQKLWQLIQQNNTAKPQMKLSQERRQQTSLPESLKKRAQFHHQLTESKMSGSTHG